MKFAFNGLEGTFDLVNSAGAGAVAVADGGTGSTSFNINGTVISGTTTTSALTALTMADGQVIIGKTGLPPVAANLTAGTNTTITNGAGSITIASTPKVVAYTEPAGYPYTVLAADYFIAVDCSVARTLLFPNAPATAGMVWCVKDSTGQSNANAITITTPGAAVTFDGATSFTVNSAWAAVCILWNGTSYRIF